jgi:(1->4)-alpha-D-glucan 1-alpha-D-glucosylmutase
MTEIPRATYRLQLSAAFTLDDAAGALPYLARLGVSHAYLSPISTARPGSTHGYDVIDHERINPELGGEAAWRRFSSAARAIGIGVLLDIVPNHVGIGGSGNAWWLDVLEWGADSVHAVRFDIRWYSQRAGLAGQVLVPMLGRQYGESLEAGEIQLRFATEEGSLSVWLPGEHRLPVRPVDYGIVLGATLPSLREQFRAQLEVGEEARAQAARLKAALAAAARDPATLRRIEQRLSRLNGKAGVAASFDALDRLIGRQHWRAASYRVAADDINYRRFFNINDLAGVRVEEPAVFDELHARVLAGCAAGEIQGLRIDHIDGLYDPAGYCARLRARLPPGCYLVVEKILASHEALPDWPVEGTTGYDFAALATALCVDDAATITFTRIYEDFAGEAQDFDSMVAECKRLVMRRELASELAVLSGMALEVAQHARRSRDFTLATLAEALREVVAWFPVYRSYVSAAGHSDVDQRHILWATARARRCLPEIDDSVFDFLAELMQGRTGGEQGSAALRFAMKLQQYTGPVMAKGMEDTAFYRYNRLLALNEVGSRPAAFGIAHSVFHQDMVRRAASSPASMLAGTTHDTKRGEDGRARLAALSAFAVEWEQQLRSSSRLIRARRGGISADTPPDAADEYYLLQTLLAAWPEAFLNTTPTEGSAEWQSFGERVFGAMLKAAREAKRHTNWNHPDESYEAALKSWLDAALDVSRANPFIELFRPFVAQVAACGRRIGLAQMLLRLTVPGVPDIYQGSECWDFSMVDPDNRRPVDFAVLDVSLASGTHAKQSLVTKTLSVRRSYPDLFARGGYRPVEVSGASANAVLAFERHWQEQRLLVVVVTHPTRFDRDGEAAHMVLRSENLAGPWRNLLDGRLWTELPSMEQLLRSSPVALLMPAGPAKTPLDA